MAESGPVGSVTYYSEAVRTSTECVDLLTRNKSFVHKFSQILDELQIRIVNIHFMVKISTPLVCNRKTSNQSLKIEAQE